MTQTIATLASKLYAAAPAATLYHYTSLDALVSIVPTRTLWATDIHYLNDSSELRYAVDLFVTEVQTQQQESLQDSDLLGQLAKWLQGRLADGHMLFITCFTEDGDLLSQWRGYTPHAKGVSVGFSPTHLLACAHEQHFEFGRCIYDRAAQSEVARLAIRAVVEAARQRGPSPQVHPSQSYHPAFEEAEPHLLRVAALLKHNAFEAEREWRVVSPYVSDYVNTKVLYRSGRTTLIPYRPFLLDLPQVAGIGVNRAVLGPTPHVNLSAQALSQFLSSHRVSGGGPISSGPSLVPYRET